MALLCLMLFTSMASCQSANGKILEGLGYREQELQVAKGTTFNDESANGIPYAAFNGGTNIFIKGLGLDEAA